MRPIGLSAPLRAGLRVGRDMRIVGGHLRGRVLPAPVPKATRPTSDRMRESLFSILNQYDLPPNYRVADIFAGTGALGFEALSRGASFAVFVDTDMAARAAIRRNGEALDMMGRSRILKRDGQRLGASPMATRFDLVFMDPPYARNLVEPCLQSLQAGGWLTPKAVICIEESRRADIKIPDGFSVDDQRDYGDSQVLFVRPA